MEFLKLITLDEDDLRIVAAYVQDAVIKTADLKLFQEQKQFIIPMNRFAWEKEKRGLFSRREHRRHQSILQFNRVLSVRSTGIERDKPNEILSLLTINFKTTAAPSGMIELVFSEKRSIILEVECIEARLTDTGAAWATSSRPQHEN